MSDHAMAGRKEPLSYLGQIAKSGDALTKFHREMLGNSARIHIPLRDVPDLGRIATILRVLASKLEVLSKDKTRDFSVLFDARSAIKLADARIRSQKALGKEVSDQ